eukprot:scaffold10020_cov161-Skeletonema_marinoi.AAC.12
MRMRLNSLDNFARKEAHEMIILLVKTSPLLPLQLHSNHEDGGEGRVSLILLVASTAAAAFLLNYHSPESAPAPTFIKVPGLSFYNNEQYVPQPYELLFKFGAVQA